jgi:hypothetical protein
MKVDEIIAVSAELATSERLRAEIRGFPLNHNETVVEWGTQGGHFMTGPPALES